MKTTLCITMSLIIMTIISCQKENLSVPRQNNIANIPILVKKAAEGIKDSVIFDTIPKGDMYDNQDGQVTCFLTLFRTIDHGDSLFLKEFQFLFNKTAGCTAIKARVYVDGIRVKTLTDINDMDTLNFFKISPAYINPQTANLRGQHSLAVDVVGTGNNGEKYSVTCISAQIITKNPRDEAISINLPIKGWDMIYHK